MTFIISIAQINIIGGRVSENLNKAEYYIHKANKIKSSLILFPELFSSGYQLEDLPSVAKNNRIVVDKLSELALKNNIFISGSLVENQKRDFFNTFIVFSPKGRVVAKYRKIHLFSPLGEKRVFKPGEGLKSLSAPWGKSGLAICYVLRFPEMFVAYRQKRVNSFLISAEWPKERISHWKTLLRSRAIETQTFIVASNSVGNTLGIDFGGSSSIIDPWGIVLAEAKENSEELISAAIDFSIADKIQRAYPFFQDRQPMKYIK